MLTTEQQTKDAIAQAGHDPALEGKRVDLIRVATAGSVDDGKSTLIGRLLLDTKSVLEDQYAAVERTSRERGHDRVDLALLTDGLRAEREQGITIDVAYRYFATPRRRFILADTPGHEQYTRNMVTGASTADLALVLIDARKGVPAQAKRHAYLSTLLGIPRLVVCVNKMDLVGFDEAVFERIAAEFRAFASGLAVEEVDFVPLSALDGDNVVERSTRTPWYRGPALLELLESASAAPARNLEQLRFPVQTVLRAEAHRAYAGQVASGVLLSGEEVVVLPSGRRTRVVAVDRFDGPVEVAPAPTSVAVRLEDELDVSRGDLIARPDDAPAPVRELDAAVCWMAEAPLAVGGRYVLKHTTRTVRAVVEAIHDRVEVETLARETGVSELGLNDVGRVRLRTSAPLMVDPYVSNRATGAFILIDEASNDTVGAGLVE